MRLLWNEIKLVTNFISYKCKSLLSTFLQNNPFDLKKKNTHTHLTRNIDFEGFLQWVQPFSQRKNLNIVNLHKRPPLHNRDIFFSPPPKLPPAPRPLSSFDTHARWVALNAKLSISMILRKNRGLWTVYSVPNLAVEERIDCITKLRFIIIRYM